VLPVEASGEVDYEGELAVIIGTGGKDIRAMDAWNHVGGITVANDVSARDIQFQGMRDGSVVDIAAIRRSKTFPTFKPVGPAVVTPDEFTLPLDLAITTRVNGELRQKGQTGEMLFSVADIVEAVSGRIQLHSGDLILTGTPAGVGLASGRYLKAGDSVEVAIEGIGNLRNTVASPESKRSG
jgi:2-keto-4-pentenoate hydratase/2-oxohepta-3-ene-1,7-dioic acid hydratase in catechol pathway